MKQHLFLYLAFPLLMACGDGNDNFDATGVFESTEVLVSAESNGRILDFSAEEGTTLQAGQMVGTIDSMQLFYQKKQLEAGLRSVGIRKPDIRKQIAAIEEEMRVLRSERKRMANLVQAKAGNQKQVDDIDNRLAVLQKQLDAQYSTLNKTSGSADAESEKISYQIMQIDDLMAKCRITNPVSGQVLVRYMEAGEMAVAGKPLYKIANMEVLYLRAYLTAGQLSAVKPGQAVRVYADYGSEGRKAYDGRVSWISEKAEFTPKGIQTKEERANLVYAVKVAVRNDGFLKIGQYGELSFDVSKPAADE